MWDRVYVGIAFISSSFVPPPKKIND